MTRIKIVNADHKVYCRDCKHITKRQLLAYGRLHNVCVIVTYHSTPYQPKERFERVFKHREKNKNNKCSDYKRKWWKFWIKSNVVYEA
jgi:hypothetical protein